MMRLGLFGKHLVSWIACIAILLGSLVPMSASHASPAAGDDVFNEICTSVGEQLAGAAERSHPSSPAKHGAHVQQHCAYCSMHATVLGLPPAPISALPALRLSFGLPEAFFTAPRTAYAWRTAQPRAPPCIT